jgi:hypothetical protein
MNGSETIGVGDISMFCRMFGYWRHQSLRCCTFILSCKQWLSNRQETDKYSISIFTSQIINDPSDIDWLLRPRMTAEFYFSFQSTFGSIRFVVFKLCCCRNGTRLLTSRRVCGWLSMFSLFCLRIKPINYAINRFSSIVLSNCDPSINILIHS